LNKLRRLVNEAIENVSRGLTEMFGANVSVKAVHVRTVPLGEVGSLLGSPEAEVMAIYLGAEGDLPGHLLLLMPVQAAEALCDVLLEQPQGTTTEMGEMERSALGEMGNIVGSFFMNSLADRSGLRLMITPPGVFQDMAGAAIDLALTDVAMYADEAVVIDANFEHEGRHLPAWFLALPDPARLPAMLAGGAA
jgi:chemotaxis protein CheC